MERARTHNPEAKRSAIMASAARLFVGNGYEQTSMAMIAKDAGVAVGSVYRQFPDKVSLLGELHREIEQELIDIMQSAWNVDLAYLERFGPMYTVLFHALTERHAIMPLLSMTKELVGSETYRPGQAIIASIEHLYFEGVDAGELREYPREVLPKIIHGMFVGGLMAWAEDPNEATEKRVVKTLANAVQSIARPVR